jgi:NADP-dependent 3-hydroxy acid dehydrogenase YdfG
MSIVIVGAGPNLGAAVARRFGREGMSVGLIARDGAKLEELANVLGEEGISVEDVRGPLEFSVLGAVAAATAVVGQMVEAGSGTILYTTGGAAVKPYPERAGVGVFFAGEVAYARMLNEELADKGVFVGHTAIAGRIAPGSDHEPDDIADALWQRHVGRGDFQLRIGFDD